MFEHVAPQMAETLKSKNVWKTPPVPLDNVSSQISITMALNQFNIPDTDFITDLQTTEFGLIPSIEVCSQLQEDESS